MLYILPTQANLTLSALLAPRWWCRWVWVEDLRYVVNGGGGGEGVHKIPYHISTCYYHRNLVFGVNMSAHIVEIYYRSSALQHKVVVRDCC